MKKLVIISAFITVLSVAAMEENQAEKLANDIIESFKDFEDKAVTSIDQKKLALIPEKNFPDFIILFVKNLGNEMDKELFNPGLEKFDLQNDVQATQINNYLKAQTQASVMRRVTAIYEQLQKQNKS